MTYGTFQILIRTGDTGKWLDVVACDIDAAVADLSAAYGEVEVITWKQVW